eukprot:290866_1
MGTCPIRPRVNLSRETASQKANSMQEVLPKIYIGSAIAAKNKALLLNNNITHIIAIGWNLQKHFENEFEYLLINEIQDSPECLILHQFEKCFSFIDKCFYKNKNNKLLVHCHKGLSRSATIIIAYQMYTYKTDYDSVFQKIRKQRPFIMPNIGFQAQLTQFKHNNYSLDMNTYSDFNVILFIQQTLQAMLNKIQFNYNAYKTSPKDVNENELFQLTLYFHQVHKLKRKHKLSQKNIIILNQSIQLLRQIQIEFVECEASMKRFDIMFK